MQEAIKYVLFIFFSLSIATSAIKGQDISVHISEISILGNKTTKDKIILRELEFNEGSTYGGQLLDALISSSEKRLLNTGLFNHAEISLKESSPGIYTVVVSLRENWYIFPSPQISFAEKDIYHWVQHDNMSINRVNIGGLLYHYNLTGNRDYLKAYAQFGYIRQFGLSYHLPYLNKAQTVGVEIEGSYSSQKEIAYSTVNDRKQFAKIGEKDVFEQLNLSLRTSYRPKMNSTHRWGVAYNRFSVVDSITVLNPGFFDNNSSGFSYFSLSYEYSFEKRDRKPIAQSGYFFNVFVRKDGIGAYSDLNQIYFNVSAGFYQPLSSRLTLFVRPSLAVQFVREKQSYFYSVNQVTPGTFRGYESYDIFGMDFLRIHSGIRFLCWSSSFNWGKVMPAHSIRVMPFKVYCALNIDTGTVIDPHFGNQNRLDNRFLVGYGPSINVLIYESMHVGFEYNFNHMGESAFYLNSSFNL